jgi:hypothetical protein
VEGGNRQVLPVFWRFCPIAKTVDGRQRPSGQAMREKQRHSGANRAGGGQCRAEARLQTGLENNGSQSVSIFGTGGESLSAAKRRKRKESTMEDIMKLCDVVRETGFAIHPEKGG